MKKKVVKKKFKFSKFKVIRNFTVIGIIGILFFSLKSNAYNDISYKTVVVSEGQTLWDIAKEEQATNYYYKNKDVRYIVKSIQNTNNLKSATIYVNQNLQIIEN